MWLGGRTMRPTETPRPAVLNSETRCAPPSSSSIPDVPRRITARTFDLSLKRQTARPERAVAVPTCTYRAQAVGPQGLQSLCTAMGQSDHGQRFW